MRVSNLEIDWKRAKSHVEKHHPEQLKEKTTIIKKSTEKQITVHKVNLK